MQIYQIKDRPLRMLMDSLWCKTEMLRTLKGFTQFDWSKEILRLTSEIGEIKGGLTDYELSLWNQIKKN
jgi:hypothetical protein